MTASLEVGCFKTQPAARGVLHLSLATLLACVVPALGMYVAIEPAVHLWPLLPFLAGKFSSYLASAIYHTHPRSISSPRHTFIALRRDVVAISISIFVTGFPWLYSDVFYMSVSAACVSAVAVAASHEKHTLRRLAIFFQAFFTVVFIGVRELTLTWTAAAALVLMGQLSFCLLLAEQPPNRKRPLFWHSEAWGHHEDAHAATVLADGLFLAAAYRSLSQNN